MAVYYNEFDPQMANWLRQLIINGEIADGTVDDRSILEVTAADLKGFTQHHFFAGVGTWSLALRNAGWSDDRSVCTASLPCQPFSVAGSQKGKEDERHLLPHFLELVREARFDTLFGEQVASSEVIGTVLEASFTLAVQEGDFAKANKLAKRLVAQKNFNADTRWLDDLQTGMEAEGFTFGAEILGAHSVNAPHIRQRLYWVAHGGVANTENRNGRPQSQLTCRDSGKTRDQFRGHGENIGMANTVRIGQSGQRAMGQSLHTTTCENREVDRAINVGDLSGQRREAATSARHGCAFSGVDWLYFRDGKYRPVKSSVTPLVDGLARGVVYRGGAINPNNTGLAGTMRIKGYGNAICEPAARLFIQSHMAVIDDLILSPLYQAITYQLLV